MVKAALAKTSPIAFMRGLTFPGGQQPVIRGEGVYLYGERVERYLDFAAGIAVNALGHGHPHLTKALQDQVATLMHVSNLYGSPQGEALAQRIVDVSFADTVFFTLPLRELLLPCHGYNRNINFQPPFRLWSV